MMFINRSCLDFLLESILRLFFSQKVKVNKETSLMVLCLSVRNDFLNSFFVRPKKLKKLDRV